MAPLSSITKNIWLIADRIKLPSSRVNLSRRLAWQVLKSLLLLDNLLLANISNDLIQLSICDRLSFRILHHLASDPILRPRSRTTFYWLVIDHLNSILYGLHLSHSIQFGH